MPLCDRKVMRSFEGEGLGICTSCAIDISDHLRQLWETPPLTERKLQRELRDRAEVKRQEDAALSRSASAGWVYYVRIDQLIKIGFASDVKRRMKAYPPHSELLAVHPGTPAFEREMHALLSGHLERGREWFRPDAPVMKHIAEVVDQFGSPPPSFIYRFGDRSDKQAIKPHRRSRH